MAGKCSVKAVWDRKSQSAKMGHGYVEIVVYLSAGQRKYMAFGKATAMEWVRIQKSRDLAKQIAKYEEIVSAMRTLGEEMTVANFESHLDLKEVVEESKKDSGMMFNGFDQTSSFIEYMKQSVEGEELRDGSRRNKTVVLDALKRFGKIVTFADLTPSNIMSFDTWLHDGTRSVATVYNYHKKVKMYTRQLRMAEMIPSDPYDKVKFNRGKYKERRPLSEKEMKKMRGMVLSGKIDRVRDLFIFSAYTGLAYCDVMDFDFTHMTEQVGDRFYIDGTRLKTGNSFFTPIFDPAMDVLRKYDYRLPSISNQKANDYLHLLEEKMGLNKPLTFHVARHTFATMLLSHDVPIENVARMLGHHDVRTTQVYAKVLKSSIERHAESVAAKLL